MTEEDFRRAVGNTTADLMKYGYELQKEQDRWMVERGKVLAVGVSCLIRFQLMYVPEVSRFKVTFGRRRLENFPAGEVRYKPLYAELHNLLWWFHKKWDVIPPTHTFWKFTDETSLVKQIKDVQALVVEYAIPWLEDPMSNVEWAKNPSRQ